METVFLGVMIPRPLFGEIENFRESKRTDRGKIPTRTSVVVEALEKGLKAIKEEVT